MATSTVSSLIETGGPGKMQQQLLQTTPRENGVATHNTNSTARTVQWEPDSHLLCQRKGYFWKMGPSPWFNSLTNPRKRGLPPWEAVWFRLRLHFGLDLHSSLLRLALMQTIKSRVRADIQINSVPISPPVQVAFRRMRKFPSPNTKIQPKLPVVGNTQAHTARYIILLKKRLSFCFKQSMSARRCLL